MIGLASGIGLAIQIHAGLEFASLLGNPSEQTAMISRRAFWLAMVLAFGSGRRSVPATSNSTMAILMEPVTVLKTRILAERLASRCS